MASREANVSRRNAQIFDALTLRIRLLSLDQIASTWWDTTSHPVRNARRHLNRLCVAGRLKCRTIPTYPMIDLAEPIFSWRPGDPQPTDAELGAIAYRLQSRWPDTPQRPTVIYTATPSMANRLGGFDGRIQHRHQVTHDLHLTELYLRLLREEPDRARRWAGEELAKPTQGHGEKLPDAFLCDDNGRPVHVIEFGGRYPKHRVRDFHEYCSTNGLSYDLC